MLRPLPHWLGAVAILGAGQLAAQATPDTPLTPDDSALITLVLEAEHSRDALSPALERALTHRDARVQRIAARARARIRDTAFSERSTVLGELASSPQWPEPEWKARYRSLAPARDDCARLVAAAHDSVWPVRLRAATLARASCNTDSALVHTFRQWAASLPAAHPARRNDGVSWQAAAHGLLAYARLRGAEADTLIARLAEHPTWQVRQYAARAAASTGNFDLLRVLAKDSAPNVAEVAIEWLATAPGRADDALFIATLARNEVPPVRAAAVALRGTTHPDAAAAALAAFERFAARANASERDVRLALLHIAGRAAHDDRAPPVEPTIPREAAALALGAVRYLEVQLDDAAGGGRFVVRLRGDVAPLMAARVLTLAREGWYDGTSWHRVEHDFVIQGGSPGANEYVGYSRYLVDELGTVSHRRGTVGMSTRGHDTGDAQWFVNLRDNARLDANYSVFAEVVEGMDVVDRIVEGDRMASIREVRRTAR